MAILPGSTTNTLLHNRECAAVADTETNPMMTTTTAEQERPMLAVTTTTTGPRCESAIITMAVGGDGDAPMDTLKSAKLKKQAWVLNKLKMPSRSVSPMATDRSEHNAKAQNEKSSELQAILTQQTEGICFLRDSPFRILRAAEAGNLDEFVRLYQGNNSRLSVQDTKGRTAAHQAAARNRVNILQYIKEQNGDLNMQDLAGNTPLHKAVEHDALEALECLLQLCVNTGVLNDKKLAPVHLATELNRVEALKIMGRHRHIIDIQKGGEHGRTALHLAAIHDHEECARILITEFGACPRRPCNNGYYPIHEAAKNASSRTMEVFFQWGESRGCTREEMISFYDAEGNVPLHSAVHGGDIKAVELCINSGAKISTQQHDLSTPVHLACAQGAMDIVKLMFTMQPAEKRVCLACVDAQKMTPLHCASMFDHPEIVEYLVNEGADINALDREGRSPLLLAASRAGWKTVNVMIRQGANIGVKDCNYRNVLHLVIMNGGRLHDFAEEVTKAQSHPVLLQLLNEKDHTGCSPLHYASREGHIRSLENLIRLGACINLKNNNNESPLHFAARYGRYNTVRQLLDSEKGSFIINESDGEGLTPLHIASQQGHTRVVQLLLNRGALLHRDHNGRNPLHLAAMSGYTQTIELLHSVHSHLLDHMDKDGNTPLHLATMENKSNAISLLLSIGCKLSYNYMTMSAIDYAIHYKYQEAALAMVTHDQRSAEVMNMRSGKHPCVTLALISSMPRVFEAVQDKCITRANCKKDSKSFYINYSFSCLQCENLYAEVDEKTGETIQISKPIPLPALNIKYAFHAYQKSAADIRMIREKDPTVNFTPLCVVNAMVSHGRVELLAHPLSQKYLQMKWNSYGKYYHVANLLIYCVFLAFVTVYCSLLMHSVIDDVVLATEAPASSLLPATIVAIVNQTQTHAAMLSDVEILADTDPPLSGAKTAALTSRHRTDQIGLDTDADSDSTIPLLNDAYPAESVAQRIAICTPMIVCAIAILAYTVVNAMREVYQVYQQKWHYLFEMNSVVSWFLYVAATIMVVPVLNGGRIEDLHYSAASVTVFLSWFNLLLFLQRFDQVGIYVVMFLEILQTLIKVLTVFSILIIAFGLSFFILMSKSNSKQSANHLSFSTIPMSLIRTFSMMLGEMDFVGTYVQPFYAQQLTFPIPAFIMLCLFMVLMPILLMNLLIGLAVGDIESVRRNAQLKRLAMQVVLHTKLEQKLPQVWLERVDKMELIEYPNTNKCKVGIFDFILRKWFCNPFTDDNTDMLMDTNEDYVAEELDKQRRKLKEIGGTLEQQHQMLRLIIQKMEIRTEADDVDEGVSPHELKSPLSQMGVGGAAGGTAGSNGGSASGRWTSPKIRKKLKHAMSFTKN